MQTSNPEIAKLIEDRKSSWNYLILVFVELILLEGLISATLKEEVYTLITSIIIN